MVVIAKAEGADAIVHGCTGKGNDQVHFELTAMALNPKLKNHRPLARVGYPQPEDAIDMPPDIKSPLCRRKRTFTARPQYLSPL